MLEETLEKIFNQLGRIADALEVANADSQVCIRTMGAAAKPVVVVPEEFVAPDPTAKKKKGKTVVAQPSTEAVPLTETTVRAALKDVLDRKGWETAEKILAEFKVKQVKALKPEDYAKVVAKCAEALHGKTQE